MKSPYVKICPCCLQLFETTRSDKIYLDANHQKRYNNAIQNFKRAQQTSWTKNHYVTHRIYSEILNGRTKARRSKEFLKGAGANLCVYTHTEEVNGEMIQCLFDIAIFDDSDYLILKKHYNGRNRTI